ncbi:hypothetical protein [Streptomyces sp. NPDC002054]|uniref:hypothetical protein n=1 Tax=Streptomyces sp. NPDC002054 TaxID=3154663 RepID=UPI00331AEBDA
MCSRRQLMTALMTATLVTAAAATATGCAADAEPDRTPSPRAAAERAARVALDGFLAAYNRAEQSSDESLLDPVATGPYAETKKAGLRANRALAPAGPPESEPLRLTDPQFAIPEHGGFFVVHTDSNRDEGTDRADSRVVLVFTRPDRAGAWRVAYASVIGRADLPAFRLTPAGWAEAVAPDARDVSVPPAELSRRYARLLTDGTLDGFAPGSATTGRRAVRARDAEQPGLTARFEDRPADEGAYAPVALRTENGGALAFFASRHIDRLTLDPTAEGAVSPLTTGVRALMRGEFTDTLTRESVSTQAVVLPPATAPGRGAAFVAQAQGVVAATAS